MSNVACLCCGIVTAARIGVALAVVAIMVAADGAEAQIGLPAPQWKSRFVARSFDLGEARRFDFGTADSPVKNGWSRVTAELVRTSQRGYGWLQAADEGFDRSEVFVPNWARVQRKPTPDDMLRDGVKAKKNLTFRVDVRNGEYWAVVSIGDEGHTVSDMSVHVNGVALGTDVTTRTSWGGYATTRTFRRRVRADAGKIEFTFSSKKDPNSVLGCEVVPFVPYSIGFSRGKWQYSGKDATVSAGLKALNAGKWAQARQTLNGIADVLVRAESLAAVADSLDVPEADAQTLVKKVVRLAEIVEGAKGVPPGPRLRAGELRRAGENYLRARKLITLAGYGQATLETGYIYARRLKIALDLCERITQDDPLFNRACLNLGRVHYWYWREGGAEEEKNAADKWFGLLKARQPRNRLVRIYNGEEMPWGEEYTTGTEGMPEWAVAQREAMGRLSQVLRWWIEQRQRPSGELGGGYGDDVEMLRQWHVYLGGLDDATVRRGWLTLAHGIWYSHVIQQLGYAASASDVQHSAEPMSDSHPALVGLDYGNPVWVERCMATVRLMRDSWTGVNSQGHRHFRSMDFGAQEVKTGKPLGVDLPCSGRASRPGLWLGWYQRNPATVKLFSEWMDAWVEDTMREAEGKPAGVVPAAVAFETDRIGGYSKNWHEMQTELYWSYFNWPGYIDMVYDHMLAAYEWTGNERYLEPIRAAMDLAMESREDGAEDPPPGGRIWAGRVLYGRMAGVIEKYRLLTGRDEYDDYLRERGSPYTKFLLSGDKSQLVKGCEAAASQARFNFELKTSEVLFTDRVSVSQSPMWSMYTGGVGPAYYYPSHFVTWRNTGPHVATLVTTADRQSLKVLACNFEERTRRVGMDLWRLEPGRYELRHGPDTDGDDKMDGEPQQQTFEMVERGTGVEVELPARSVQVIEISRRSGPEPGLSDLTDRADLAVGAQDVFVGRAVDEAKAFDDWLRPWEAQVVKAAEGVPVTVVVHNIGRRAANPSVVKLQARQDGDWIEVASAEVPALEAPNDLLPRRSMVELSWRPPAAGEYELEVSVAPVPGQPEITGRNNAVLARVRVEP